MTFTDGNAFTPAQEIPEFPTGISPAAEWDRDAVRRSLDELFSLTRQYRSTRAYSDLLRFIARFRFYAPFNAMLVHIQMPGATYVAPAHRWLDDYGRRIKPGARPLVILQPMGPVMFVFDVSDTEGPPGAPPLPKKVLCPFETRRGCVGRELERTVETSKRDGVEITERQAGSQSAGLIRVAQRRGPLKYRFRQQPDPQYVEVPLQYELLVNAGHPREVKYATIVHELAHLYCGHLGTPNPAWWPDRRGLHVAVCEFEAESVCYLVCSRLSIDNPSDEYLSNYVQCGDLDTPPISLECVMKVAGLIEQMGRDLLKPRGRLKSDNRTEYPLKTISPTAGPSTKR